MKSSAITTIKEPQTTQKITNSASNEAKQISMDGKRISEGADIVVNKSRERKEHPTGKYSSLNSVCS